MAANDELDFPSMISALSEYSPEEVTHSVRVFLDDDENGDKLDLFANIEKVFDLPKEVIAAIALGLSLHNYEQGKRTITKVDLLACESTRALGNSEEALREVGRLDSKYDKKTADLEATLKGLCASEFKKLQAESKKRSEVPSVHAHGLKVNSTQKPGRSERQTEEQLQDVLDRGTKAAARLKEADKKNELRISKLQAIQEERKMQVKKKENELHHNRSLTNINLIDQIKAKTARAAGNENISKCRNSGLPAEDDIKKAFQKGKYPARAPPSEPSPLPSRSAP